MWNILITNHYYNLIYPFIYTDFFAMCPPPLMNKLVVFAQFWQYSLIASFKFQM